MMKWILIATAVFAYAIMAWTLGLVGKNNKNVILENTVAPAHTKEPAILELAAEYRKRQWQVAAVATLLTLPILLPLPESIALALFMLLLFGSLGCSYACEITYIRKMHRLVSENNWQPPVNQDILVDTRLVTGKNRKLLPLWWLLPAGLLLLAAALFLKPTDDSSYWVLLGTSGGMLLLFVGMWFVVKRLPVRPHTGDSRLNQRYNDLTKFYWSLLTILCGYLSLPLMIAPLLADQTKGWLSQFFVILFILAMILLLVLTIGLLLRLRSKQDALISQSPDYRYSGDDQFWRWGVYINPNDPRIMIPDRVGMNISANLGRPVIKVLGVLLGIFLIAIIPLATLPSYLYDFASDPFRLEVKKEAVVITAPFTTTSEISLAEIQEVNELTKLPGNVRRTNGYGGERYSTGHFTVNDKAANVYLDDRSRPILQIVTKDKDYYFTSKEPADTRKAYQELKELLK